MIVVLFVVLGLLVVVQARDAIRDCRSTRG